MNEHFTLHVHAHNHHGVLPRILLLLSRRRLRIQGLQFFDVNPNRPAELQLDLDCEREDARQVSLQLQRIVEVTQVWMEHTPVEESVRAPGKLAAA